jgi:hypothetical protein
MDCPWDISILALSSVLLDKLKAAGSAHGVLALRTRLQLAYSLSVWQVLAHTREGLPMTLGTPKSERRADLGHAHCTGNHVASFELHLRPRADDAFWAVAARLSASLRSASELALARGRIGVLAHIPHSWAPVFATSAAGPAPYINSVYVSNLAKQIYPRARSMRFGRRALARSGWRRSRRTFWGMRAGCVSRRYGARAQLRTERCWRWSGSLKES